MTRRATAVIPWTATFCATAVTCRGFDPRSLDLLLPVTLYMSPNSEGQVHPGPHTKHFRSVCLLTAQPNHSCHMMGLGKGSPCLLWECDPSKSNMSTHPEAHADVKPSDPHTVFKVKAIGLEEKWSLHIFQLGSAVTTISYSYSYLDRTGPGWLCCAFRAGSLQTASWTA